MDVFDLQAQKEFAPDHHVYKFLAETPYCSISVVGWEPGQTSPVHSHPTADEIYHVIEGEGLFNDGRREVRLRPGDTVSLTVEGIGTLTNTVVPGVDPVPLPAGRRRSRERP